MTAAEIAHALGGARTTRGWLCRCPAHDDQTPSLSISDGDDGTLLVKCFAGCDARDILAALRQRGLLDGKYSAGNFAPYSLQSHKADDTTKRRMESARAIWCRTIPAKGTPVECYLVSRGYDGSIPPTLRAALSLIHSGTGRKFPAMVAAVTVAPARTVVAVHRTYLTPDGKSKAPVPDPKMSLGPIAGGAVRLALAGEVLAITEGIETGLSVMLASGIPTWAALSAGGLRKLILPPLPIASEVIIAADADPVGLGAAENAAWRWKSEGRNVRVAIPPAGQDFNDVLMEDVA